MPSYHIPLHSDEVYYVFSRAVGHEKLFIEERNYSFFLEKVEKYISPIADILAWCLFPNHFHILVRIKDTETLSARYSFLKKRPSSAETDLTDFTMEQFSNLLNSYTKSFNKVYKRKGSLFIDFMRRVKINDDQQYRDVIFYIHKNPVHHCIAENIEDWKWTSYHNFINFANGDPLHLEVIDLFGGFNAFVEFHRQIILPKNSLELEEQ